MMNQAWTDERINSLRQLHSEGFTFSEIARALGTSRGSCIGKADRLQLPERPRPQAKKPTRRPHQPLSEVGRLHLLDIRDHHCRFPIGEPEQPGFAFCGAEKVRGAYCAHHADIAYRPATWSRR